MVSARREDLRAIWECLSLSWKFLGDREMFYRQRGEEGWRTLEQFLDLSNAEWRAAKRAAAVAAQQAMGGLPFGLGQIEYLVTVDENGQQVHVPVADLPANTPVPVNVGGIQVEVVMPQPGQAGLIQALQQAVQLAEEAMVAQVEEGQVQNLEEGHGHLA